MSDALLAGPVSATLSARAAIVARAIAAVLVTRCSSAAGADETVAFLHEWADSARQPTDERDTPLDLLATTFRLTEQEIQLILLAGLADEHEGLATTFRSLHPLGEPCPTPGLAALLAGGSGQERTKLRAALADGNARRFGILLVSGSGSFWERSLQLPDALWDVLHGTDAWPASLKRVALEPPPPGLQGWLEEESVAAAVRLLADGRSATVVVNATDDAVGCSRAVTLAAAAGRSLVGGQMRAGDTERVRLLAVHAAARGAAPLVVAEAGQDAAPVALAGGELPGPVLVCAAPGSVRATPDRAVLSLGAGPVGTNDQVAAWRAAVPELEHEAGLLAARHPLDPAVTAQLAVDVRAWGRIVTPAAVTSMIRARAASSLPTGVRLFTPQVPWSHVVLPAESALQLRDAVARLDHQAMVLDEWRLRDRAHAARGARLLLTGPPGTGKSLAAGAVATAAQTDLLVVDVSQVVSKWLGETEKNLAAAFDAAERTQAVLLLDEADALFGTRTEISDSHDRYANLETAYLLQRLDRFEGLAILTTNLRANIDAAFIRRMDFVVDFPLPNAAGRTELWVKHLPPEALADDIEIDALARLYPVPGAWIRNASVAAAFGAAAARSQITAQRLVAAMRREYAKASLPFPGEPPRRRDDTV
jgi:hypothetical protein